jgi:hypothetical protein
MRAKPERDLRWSSESGDVDDEYVDDEQRQCRRNLRDHAILILELGSAASRC